MRSSRTFFFAVIIFSLSLTEAVAQDKYKSHIAYFIADTLFELPHEVPSSGRKVEAVPTRLPNEAQGWVHLRLNGAEQDQKLVLLLFSGALEFWIKEKHDSVYTWSGKDYDFANPYQYDMPHVYRRGYYSHVIYHVNHNAVPVFLKAKNEISVWIKPNHEFFGINDWRDIHVVDLQSFQRAEDANLFKLALFVGFTFSLLVLSFFIINRGLVEGVFYYALLCISNLIFIVGYFPVGSLFADWIEEVAFPHYFVFPISQCFYYAFVFSIFSVSRRIKIVVIAPIILSFCALLLTYWLGHDIHDANQLLAVINLVSSGCSLPVYGLVLYSKRKEAKSLGIGLYLGIGILMSNIAGIIAALSQTGRWFSLWMTTWDYVMLGNLLEQCLFAFGIVKFFEIQIGERFVLAHRLKNEQEKVDELSRDAVETQIDVVETERHLTTAVEKLKVMESSLTGSEHSKEIREMISLLNKQNVGYKLHDSVKLLISQRSPEFWEYHQFTYPDLTSSELRLLGYYFLRLSNKEVANLLHISVNSLYVIKNRLKKKLSLDKNTSIENYIERLSQEESFSSFVSKKG